MSKLQTRIDTLLEVAELWLSNDNQYLMRAAGQTVEEGFFAEHDVKFALQAIKKSINRKGLEKWVKRAGLDDKNDARRKNVLCLHAGNLPLVGFQNAFAALLSGARYTGKISRKDPYLLPSFLNEIRKTAIWNNRNVQWSHRLADLEGMQNDAILFAGSDQSVPGVRKAVKELNLSSSKTRFLIRIAHFSIAYLDRRDKKTLKNLTEAIFRYGGKGCRSTAVVVSPIGLERLRNDLTIYAQSFFQQNPQHFKPAPRLRQQFAYNKAIGRNQIWLDNFLLQEGGLEFDQDFICYWVKGETSAVDKIAKRHDKMLQSVYTTRPYIEIPGFDGQIEDLADAQQPPIDWKPDGTDILEWLIKKN
ncbi:MAG TPA: acyl-CoA reductase [Balneolaceae bacterium]|nr:acyl-CoA reductase [Balneolaceae bacterium]